MAKEPENNFCFPEGDLEIAAATWHTHPLNNANLSLPDYWFFLAWPNLVHFIIYKSEVRCYLYFDGTLLYIQNEDDLSPRLPS